MSADCINIIRESVSSVCHTIRDLRAVFLEVKPPEIIYSKLSVHLKSIFLETRKQEGVISLSDSV